MQEKDLGGEKQCSKRAKTMAPTTTSSSNIAPKKIRVIGVPLDLGQSRRGVDMGPSAMRVAFFRLTRHGGRVLDSRYSIVSPVRSTTTSDRWRTKLAKYSDAMRLLTVRRNTLCRVRKRRT